MNLPRTWDDFRSLVSLNRTVTHIHMNGAPEDADSGLKSINDDIQQNSIDRVRSNLKGWGTSVEEAEDVDNPIFDNLFDIYNNIEIDEHVLGLTDTIFNRVSQTPFQISAKGDGKKDDDKTALFEKSWFFDFIQYALSADYWNFSLIQFMKIKDGVFSGVENVNRYHIRPDQSGVVKSRGLDQPYLYYDKPPYSNWTVFVGSRVHLGRYNSIAKRFIMKRDVNQYWAVFNELFTTPYFTVKTDLNNKSHRKNLLDMLLGRKHSGFNVIGTDDELTALSNSGTGWKSYEAFEVKQNQGMSKAFLGGTMVLDDGSSRSQSEVHERQLELFINAKRIALAFIINEELIPKMSALGIKLASDDVFKFVISDNLSLADWAEIISKLALMFDLDASEISEKVGLKLDNKQSMPTPEKVAEAIKKLYNDVPS